MRDDQKQRLAELQEMLLDVFLDEADPRTWSGHGQTGAEMDREARGARHWDKKNAAGTMMILSGVDKLKENSKEALGRDPYEEEELDSQINAAERAATKLLEKVQAAGKL